MKMLNLVGWLVVACVLFAIAPDLAIAQDSLGDAANSMRGETTSFGRLAVGVFALVGVVIAGIGIIKLINAKKNNEPIGAAIGMVLGGAVLTALLVVIGLTTQTTVQKDPQGIEEFGE